MDNMSNYDVCYSIYFFQNVYTNLRKNRNLECWVIFGHLWVKNGGEKAYQPPAAQNPGNAPTTAQEILCQVPVLLRTVKALLSIANILCQIPIWSWAICSNKKKKISENQT